MRLALLTVVAVATIGSTAGLADARDLTVSHKPFAKMTVHETASWLHRQIARDKAVLRYWKHAYDTRYDVRQRETRWATVSLRIATRNLRRYETRPRHRVLASVGGYPPHHALWTCISRFEGSPTSVNPNGHYGMLQMHADWGYGTSHHASDDPQIVQEWAAERAYKSSGYSQSFLYGQWFNYDGAAGSCLQYA